jgi:cytochrome P450
MSGEGETQRFSHHDPDRMADPYAFYAEARSRCPVGHSDDLGGFFFSLSHAATKEVLSSYRQFTSREGVALPAMPSRLLPVDLDPPLQTRFRKVLNRFFSVEAAQAYRPTIEHVVNALIDSFIADGTADIAGQLTRPAATGIMLPLIGVPVAERAGLTEALDFLSNARTTDATELEKTMGFISQCLMTLVTSRRESPGDDADYVQFLLDEPIDGKLLTDAEVFQVLLVTLFGALDTTHATLNMTLLHLAREPGDKQQLISGEIEWPGAIEEFVRFASPIQFLRRTVTEPIDFYDVSLPAGAPILAGIGAGNRDPQVFAEPDRCILARDAREHLGFGSGAHVCLGRNFARTIIDVVLKTVLARLPDFSVAPDFVPEFTSGEGRRMKKLPMRFTPGRRPTS